MIKRLEYNPNALPESVYSCICLLDVQRISEELIFTDSEGNKLNCFVRSEHIDTFKRRLSKGFYNDEDGDPYSLKDFNRLFIHYCKGFNDGYEEYIKTLKNPSFIKPASIDLRYRNFQMVHNSYFPLSEDEGNPNREKELIGENREIRKYLDEDILYEAGYEGGGLYKAWEIIFETPMLFKPFFDEMLSETEQTSTGNSRTHLSKLTGYNETDDKIQSNQTNNQQFACELSQLFDSVSKYQIIMGIIAGQGLIDPVTYIWKYSGNGTKRYLASLVKHLHAKGYFKYPPTNEQIKAVCQHTFGWPVSIDTIKHAKPARNEFGFIPASSTLP